MSTTNQTTEGAAIDGAFLSTLQNHRRGEVISDLSDSLRQVTEAVQLTGKGGKVCLILSIRPASKGGALVIEDEIKTTLPKTEGEGSIFFADDQGNLLREDPRQQKLALRTVEGGVADEPALKKVQVQSEG